MHIAEVSPTDDALTDLMSRHLDLMRASSPACSVHAMDAERLAAANVRFFAAFEDGKAIGMGALKALADGNGEVKSMHVHIDHRGGGLADAILERLVVSALDAGMRTVSLETGSQDAFAPARAFYARHGFTECPPFEGYVLDPNSVFMSRSL